MRIFSLFILWFSCLAVTVEADVESPEPQSKLDTSDTSVTAEGLPSTFVNHVNTIFGNFLLPTIDMVVPGPLPLSIVRYYNSSGTQSKWLHGYGMSTNYPLWIRGSTPNSLIHGMVDYCSNTGGEVLPFPAIDLEDAPHPYIPDELAQTRFPGTDEDEDDYDDDMDDEDDEEISATQISHHHHGHDKKKDKEKKEREKAAEKEREKEKEAEREGQKKEEERREKEKKKEKRRKEKEEKQRSKEEKERKKEKLKEKEKKKELKEAEEKQERKEKRRRREEEEERKKEEAKRKKEAKDSAERDRQEAKREEHIRDDEKEKHKNHHDKGEERSFAYAYVEEDGGSILCASAEPHMNDMNFYLDPQTIHKGLTNVGTGEISARTNLKNTKILFHRIVGEHKSFRRDLEWKVLLSNGGERLYRKGQEFNKDKILQEERKPNGNKLHFECGKEKRWGIPLKEIKATNTSLNHTFGRLNVEYHKEDEKQGAKKVVVRGSNGKQVTYYYERHSVDEYEDKVPFITKVISSDQPDVKYEYSHYDHRKKCLLSKIVYPNGRYLRLEYDDEGRVTKQKGPVGKNGSEKTIYEFHYHPESYYTSVTDANGNKRKYHYSSKKRLKSIENIEIKKNHSKEERKLLREEKYFWGEKEGLKRGERDSGDEGHLLAKAVVDVKGAVSCTRFVYDEFGNVIREKLFGDLSGTTKGHFPLSDEGHPQGDVECYEKQAFYNNDKFHMCCEKTEDFGPHIVFYYKEGTDLLERKFIKKGSHILSREFYEYDEDAVLVKKTVDDGSSSNLYSMDGVTERHSTYITPVRGKEDYGIGQPQDVKECFLENGKEVLLKRTTYEYTKKGKVSKETFFDANNEERYHIDYSYGSKGRLTHKVNSAGREYTFEYDENGNKTREELVRSDFHKNYVYDRANRLIQEQTCHHNGPTFNTYYTYDDAGNKTSMTDRFGLVTRYEHDGIGRVQAVFYPDMLNKNNERISPQERFEYDVNGHVTSFTDKEGVETNQKYNVRGKPKIITYPDESQERFVYNKNGTLSWKTDKHGVETAYEYDILGRVTKTVVNGVKVTLHRYSSFHETSMFDPMGNTTLYRYDGAGRILEEEKNGKTKHFSYDECGRRKSVNETLHDGSKVETILFYDLLDRIIEEKTQCSDGTLLSRSQYAYDNLDNRIAVMTYSSADVYHIERTEYNSQGLVTKHMDALNNITYYSYDWEWKNELNQNCLKKTMIDPLGNKTIQIMDAYGRLDTVEKRSSKNVLLAKTTFRYTQLGNKTLEKQFVYVDGSLLREYVVKSDYTSTGLLALCTEQPNTPDEKKTDYSYMKGGLLKTLTKPDDVELHHTYDGFSRLASLVSSDGSINYTYEYDLNDNVLSVRDNIFGLTHSKVYDGDNRVLGDRIGTGIETKFSYDRLNRVTDLTFSTGQKVAYRYNSNGLREVVRKDFSNNELYTHKYEDFDLRGNVVRSSCIASCGTLQYTWDALSRLEKVSSQHFEENCAKFDAVGNLLEITETDPEGKMTYSFVYDDIYQLKEEKGLADVKYKCDSINNRLKKNDENYEINSLNQLLSEGDTSYTYDKNGNPIVVGECLLSYDALDRLVAFEKPGDTRAEYVYDSYHRRILKKMFSWQNGAWQETQTLKFIFFNTREVGSIDQTLAIREFRTLGLGKGAELGASIAIEVGGSIYCPIHDHRGNISVLIDTETKQPIDTYRYSAFGEEETFGPTMSPWRFASKRTDPESGYVFFDRRYYSPEAGRFLTPDPTGFSDGPNLYSYVHNSPLFLMDPYGLFSMETFYTGVSRASSAFYNSDELRHVSNNPASEDPSKKVETTIHQNGTMSHSENAFGNVSDFVFKQPHVEWLIHGEGFYKEYQGKNLNGKTTTCWNGIATTYSKARENAEMIKDIAENKCKDVLICHNPSEGFWMDVAECALQWLGIDTYVDKQVREQLQRVYDKCDAHKIEINPSHNMHSQGALTGNRVLSDSSFQKGGDYEKYGAGKIFTYGAPIHPSNSQNYMACGDFVPSLAFFHRDLTLSKDENTMACGAMQSPWDAHDFQGDSYQAGVKDAIENKGMFSE